MDEDEEGQLPEPKIGTTEAIGIGLFILVLDLIDLIPLAGDLTDAPALLVNWYLYKKGINGLSFIVSEVLDLIPIIQEFPTRSIVWWVLIYMDHHPSRLTEVAEQVGELAQGAEGGVEGGGAAGAAEGATGEAAQGAEGASQTESRPSEKKRGNEGRQGESSEEGGVEGGEEDQEAAERRAKEEGVEREMETGAEVSPEDEAKVANFPTNDNIIQFDKAKAGLQEKRRGEVGGYEEYKKDKAA